MISCEELARYRQEALQMFGRAHIVVTTAEVESLEIADFGLSRFDEIGLAVLVYVNTERCCGKELAMCPRQTCPEHRHPSVDGQPGKEETFRCRWGTVFLYVQGEHTPDPRCRPPVGREQSFTVWHEIELRPGDQYTIFPNTLHWFQAGHEGAVVSEFSTRSQDEFDIFTDAEIQRATRIV